VPPGRHRDYEAQASADGSRPDVVLNLAGRGRLAIDAKFPLVARAATGMATDHPELLTRKPGRAEWKLLAAWLSELWPHDEYTAIVAEASPQDRPPGTQDRR